jgi:hypothetical protein
MRFAACGERRDCLFQLPQAQGLIIRGRGQHCAVRREGNAVHAARVSLQRTLVYRVVRGRSQYSPVRREGHLSSIFNRKSVGSRSKFLGGQSGRWGQIVAGVRPTLLRCRSRQLCRFSAAGNDSLTTRYGERRLKSAKARSRVVLGTDWQRRYVDCDTSAELVCGREVDTPNASATRLVD